MRGRHVLAVLGLLGVASVTGCSADRSDAEVSADRAADSVEPALIESGGWTLEAAYIDSTGRDDADEGDRVRVEATIPNLVKGECARSPLPTDECYQSALDGQIQAAEKRGDLPSVGCSEVQQVHHGPTAFGKVGIWCKVGWNSVEHEREYPMIPVAHPIQFDTDGTVWLRVAEDGRDTSCTVVRIERMNRVECFAANPEQIAQILPRMTGLVGVRTEDGDDWSSGKYIGIRIRGERP